MRERRHLSGNSNRPLSARCDESPTLDAANSRHGTMTARRADDADKRPQPSHARRIHSARVERPSTPSSTISSRSRPSTSAQSEHSALPLLTTTNPLGVTTDNSSHVQWAVHVTTPTPTDAVPVPPHLQPVLQDFSALLRDRYEGKRSLRVAFRNWDRDKDGQLSLHEIRDMIHALGVTKKLGHENVDAIIDHVASLPTQSLKYDDFCGYIYTKDPSPASSGARRPTTTTNPESDHRSDESNSVVLSSGRALYRTVDRVVNLLRKKYESRQLRSVFRHWDADKDGCITLHEMDVNLRRQGIKLPASQLKELFDKHDVNQNGKLKYSEFMEMIYGPVASDHANPALQARLSEATKQENQPPDPLAILRNGALENPVQRIDEAAICTAVQRKLKSFAPRIHDAYSAFDDDHSGNLSYHELRQGLNELGLHFTEREFLHLAALADTDGSGEISFREFNTLFQRKPSSQSPKDPAKECENDPELVAKQRTRLSRGTFDFSHLTRRARVPTRHGRTPYPNTKDLLSSGATATSSGSGQFATETSLYGSGQSVARHHRGDTACLTLGQEEKQRKDAQYASRLERIRKAQHDYDAKTIPLHDAYDNMQQRRIETLHRHQQRYQASIEEHRPSQPHYPPQVTNRVRHITTPPYLHKL